MATPKVLIKRSSVPGRAPTAGDLQYGELAINYADGKIYYKTSSNSVASFIDSARVQAIADAVEVLAQAQLDSGELVALVDSDYVQARVPLSYLEGHIDPAYVQARQDYSYLALTDLPDFFDSNDATILIDSAYVQARQITYNTSDFLDSNTVALVVDSAYVQARQVDFFRDSSFVTSIVDTAYIQARDRFRDSAFVTGIVDSAYIQARDRYRDSTFVTGIVDSAYVKNIADSDYIKTVTGIDADTLDGQNGTYYLDWTNVTSKPVILDTVDVSNIITTDVDKAFVDALNVDADTLDGYHAQYFIDKIDSNTAAMLDSVEAIALIDSAHVQARQITYNTSDFLDSNTVSLVVDSAYVQARQLTFDQLLDSAEVVALIDSAYVQARQLTFDQLLDSAEVIDLVDSAYVQARMGTTTNLPEGSNLYYTKGRVDSDIAASFNDSSNTVNVTINTFIEDKVDSAYVLARVEDRTDSAWIQPIARKGLNGGANITYNNITGDIALDSSITINKFIADSGEIEKLKFDTTTYTDADVPDTLPTFAEGNLFYFQGPDALTYSNSNINIKIGQDEVVRVYNNSGSDIGKGKVVYVTGASNDFPTIALAKSDAFNTVYTTIGLTSHAISNGTFGFVTVRGLFGGLNTIGFTAGDVVHVSFDSAGELTATQPEYPNYPFEVGTVLVVDSASGGAVGGCIQVNPRSEVFEGVRVQGNGRVDGNLTIAGDLSILGSEFKTTVTNLNVGDNFIYIGAGDTLTANFVGTGLNDATFKDYYEGDSNLVYYVKVTATDSLGDTIQWGFDSANFVPLGFDSANGATTWDLGTDNTLIPLRYNIKVTFEATTGHTIGDYWYDSAAPTNQDLGIVGNYNLPDAPYSHAGFFRDASDQKFKVFNKYDPEVTGDINTSDPSFELGTMVASAFEGNLTGNVTGTVSDISNHTTTALAEGDNLYYTTARHDSDTLAQVTSAYVQARQTTYNTSNFTDSAFVTGLPVSTFTNDANYLDSTTVQGVIDATYIQANQTTYNTSDFTDSAFVTGLPVSTFTNDANYLDSITATQLIDSAYILTRSPAGIDSDLVVQIIDSDYVQLRQISVTAAPFTQKTYVYTADSGQTVFTGADNNGLTLAYVADRVQVYLNGLLLVDSDDYTATNGTSITLITAADSADVLQVEYLSGNNIGLDSAQVQTLIDSAYIQLRQADIYRDSGFVTGIVDSAYIQLRQTAQDFAYSSLTGAPVVFDSAMVDDIIDSNVRNDLFQNNNTIGPDNLGVANYGVYIGQFTASGVISSDQRNTHIGNRAGMDTNNADDNVYVGYNAGGSYGGSNNVAIGSDANLLSDGSNTIVIGQGADAWPGSIAIGQQTRTNDGGISIGYQAAGAETSVIIGTSAGQQNLDSGNVIIGYQAGNNTDGTNPGGSRNIAIGTSTLGSLHGNGLQSLAVNNVVIGHEAGAGISRGYGNIVIGKSNAGKTINIGNNNIVIGHNAGATIPNWIVTSNTLAIGDSNINRLIIEGLGIDTEQADSGQVLIWDNAAGQFYWGQGGQIYTTADFTDSAWVLSQIPTFGNDYVDSAAVVAIIASETLDSDLITQLVDSAYIQLRDRFQDSSLVTSTVNASYITGLIDDGQLIVDGDGSTNGVTIKSGGIEVRTDSAVGYIDLYCEVNNAHKARIKSAPHASYSGNVELTLPVSTGTIALTSDIPALGTDYVDSGQVTAIIDSAYIQLRQADIYRDSGFVTGIIDSAYITARTSAGTDSATVVAIIEATVDSAYVQLRQSAGGGGGSQNVFQNIYVSGQDSIVADGTSDTLIFEAGPGITISTDANTDTVTIAYSLEEEHIDSAVVASIFAEQGGVREYNTLNINKYYYTATASQTVFTGSDIFGNTLNVAPGNTEVYLNGLLLVDSDDYSITASTVTLTTAADSGYSLSIIETIGKVQTLTLNETKFEYTADSGQTVFTGVDNNSLTLSYSTSGFVDVFLNGILLSETNDYTTNAAGNTITLITAADSADLLTVLYRKGNIVSPTVDIFEFSADSGQTVITGSDANSNTLSYAAGAIQVHLNGILLKPSVDYTATNGTSITMTNPLDSADDLVVSTFSAPGTYLEKFKFNADSGQTVFYGNDFTGNRLVYEVGQIQVYLNGILLADSDYTASNSTKVTLAQSANINDELVVHSFSRATTSQPITVNAVEGVDSAAVISLIDSAYVQARQANSFTWTEVTSSVTLTNNSKNIIDCSGGAVTATLPASPTLGDEIRIIDGTGNAAANNITIGRNGKKIQGADSDFTIDLNRAGVGFVFYNDSQGWILIEN